MEIAKGIGRLFYIISANETSVRNVEEIPNPNYVNQAIPYFLTFIVLEYLIQWYKNYDRTRLNDGITSLSHGMYLGCQEMLTQGILHYAYFKIYENWRVYDLPWDSPVTWYVAGVTVDFCYYWVHRAAHEINIFWAKHQVHHSSEDYNLTTALRQSVSQEWFSWPFYLPMALFVPPPIYMIHKQFNLLYQFWIHTEIIQDLGVLELVLNTPKHHRVHHGSNRYCLDKNYAGVLIIWDRLFGTFAEEKPTEKIVYGLVEDIKSFNPFWLQIFHYQKIWRKIVQHESLRDKLSSVFNGPGWSPGKPRLGDPKDCPESPIREKFNVELPLWKNVYVAFHFLITLIGFNYLALNFLKFGQLTTILCILFILFSLTSIGLILEDRSVGLMTEIGRCTAAIFYLLWCASGVPLAYPIITQALYGVFAISIGIWSIALALLSPTKDKLY